MYYINLFKEDIPNRSLLDSLEFDRISGVEKSSVESPFLERKVYNSMMGMKGDKAPGPMDFPFPFFINVGTS